MNLIHSICGPNFIHTKNAEDIVQFAALDVAAVQQTAPTFQNQQVQGLNEYDYIEMNYQVRSQGGKIQAEY